MGNKLAGYRRMIGITQLQISEILGISTTTYSFKENMKTEFTRSEMIKITKCLKNYFPNITMDEIFFDS